MERIRELRHGGSRIVLIDLSGLPANEARRLLVDERTVVATYPPKTALTLTDVTDAMFDDSTVQTARETVKLNEPFVRAAALVGVKGLQKIILGAMVRLTGRDLRLFATREEALDWLAKQ